MSRRIYYGIDYDIEFEDTRQLEIYNLSDMYNENYFSNSNAGVLLDRYGHYPNWERFHGVNPLHAWDYIEEKKGLYRKEGLNKIEVLKRLAFEDIIKFENIKRVSGAFKPHGNELSVHTVIKFVIDCSRILPDEVFYLEDEGYSLYVPLEIKNGKAKPNYTEIERSVEKAIKMNNPKIFKLAKFIYYKQLVDRNIDYQDVKDFIRPISLKAYNKNKEGKRGENSNFDFEELSEYIADRIIDEEKLVAYFYEDINNYPFL